MGSPNKLIAFAIVSSIFLGFMTGKMPGPGIGKPFSAADDEAYNNLTEDQRSEWAAGFGAAGACLIGSAIGIGFTVATAGAGIFAGLGFAALGCGVGGITFGVTSSLLAGDNPLENLPVVGPIVQFFTYVVSYIVWLLVMTTFGFGIEGTPEWARGIVPAIFAASLAWYLVRIVQGAKA